jgi:peptidoglycan/LPS O-acetylase OafA/YrhL
MRVDTGPGRLSDRRWDIDWLRLLVVVGMLVPFHVFRLFDTRDPFYIKNNPPSTALNWYLILGDTIGMALLFLLAGAAAWFALQHASAGRFAWLRIKRLLVPFLVGMLVIVPPQLYYAARWHGYAGSFFDWLPTFFTFIPDNVGAWDGSGWSPAHLWFILYLLVISLVALPVLALLRTRLGHRLAGLLARSGVIGALLFVPLALVVAGYLMPDFDPNPIYYLVWFVSGYVMLCDPRFEETVARIKVPTLLLGLLGLLFTILWQYELLPGLAQSMDGDTQELIRKCFTAWFLILALLGYARAYLREQPDSHRTLAAVAYLGEASYPFYILHQTVIVILGYYIIPWALPFAVKYLLLVALTYAITLAIYDVAVRRSNVTRFLFGMRPLRREEPRVALA